MGMFELKVSTAESENKKFCNAKSDTTISKAISLQEIHAERISRIDDKVCSELIPGVMYFILTVNKVNVISFIEWILFHSESGFIEDMTISTYSVGSIVVRHFCRLYDSGKIKNMTFIVCEQFFKIKDSRLMELVNLCESRGIKIYAKSNHSKITLIRCDKKKNSNNRERKFCGKFTYRTIHTA